MYDDLFVGLVMFLLFVLSHLISKFVHVKNNQSETVERYRKFTIVITNMIHTRELRRYLFLYIQVRAIYLFFHVILLLGQLPPS